MNIGVFFIQSTGQTLVIFQTVIVLATKNQLISRSNAILKIGIIPIYGDRGIFPHKAANYRHFPTLKATPPKHNTSQKSLNHTDQNRLHSFNLLYKSFNYFSLATPSHEYIKVLTISLTIAKP